MGDISGNRPVCQPSVFAEDGFEDFVKREGDRLMEGGKEYRFVSFNIPNLHYVEDQLAFEAPSAWRLPDTYEIEDGLLTVKQMGGQVVRIYALSVRRPSDPPDLPRHVLAPGSFDESTFKVLDRVLERANALGVRLIIPFIDNWKWWGGRGEYAAFRGKQPNDFWRDPELIADFKKTIEYVINRKNSITGTSYRDDKAILAWETGNELECPQTWTHDIASYVKSLDPNHLVLDGRHGEQLRQEAIDEPATDFVTTHHYPDNPQNSINFIVQNSAKTKGKKPYFVGEFGFVSTDAFRLFFDTVLREGICGALVWSLRSHAREGGFYWHSEPLGGDIYKSYHWPGFRSGAGYDEANVLALMKQKAYEIRGLSIPGPTRPGVPHLLEISHPAFISWQGSAGATSYRVDRSESADGPWDELAAEADDAAMQYRPLFCDATAVPGKSYFYRVTAENAGGLSNPSNTVGPVKVEGSVLIDEMEKFDESFHHGGKLTIESREARKAKEDIHRLRGEKDAFVTYRVSRSMTRFRLYTFFPADITDFVVLASPDGLRFSPIGLERKGIPGRRPEYGYWKPVLFEAGRIPPEARFLRFVFPVLSEISRVEIYY